MAANKVSSAEWQELERLATEVSQRAYAPYSRFFVGAAVLLESGEMIAGCNVENASFRLTTCAEQNAIVAAVARCGPATRVRAVVVVNRANTACSPCGACRQTIAEFTGPEAMIAFPGEAGTRVLQSVREMLPYSFALEPA